MFKRENQVDLNLNPQPTAYYVTRGKLFNLYEIQALKYIYIVVSVAQLAKLLLLAQVNSSESWERVLHGASCSARSLLLSLLLFLPFPALFILSLSLK